MAVIPIDQLIGQPQGKKKVIPIGELVNPAPRGRNVSDIPESEFTPKNVALETAKGTAGVIARSGGKLIGDVAQAALHPIQTLQGVGGVILGGAQKLIPGEQQNEKQFNAVGDLYKKRYGGAENIATTVAEDPIGFLSDVAMGAGAVGAAAKISKIPSLAEAGKVSTEFARGIDPIAQTVKGVGTVIKKATEGRKIAPFAGKVDKAVVDAAKATGVDLPVSATTTSRFIPQAEGFAAKGLFGQGIVDRIEKARVDLSKYADSVISKSGQSSNLASAGQAIADGVKTYRKSFFDIKEKLYDAATLPDGVTGQIIKVSPTSARDFVNTILQDKERAASLLGKSTDIEYFKTLSDNLNIPVVDGRFVKSALRELNNKISNISDPIATGNKATLRKVAALLSDDLDNAVIAQRPDLAKSIQAANSFYKDGITRLNSEYGKKIFDLADKGQYSEILPSIVGSGTAVEDIPKIYQIIGKQNVPGVQAAFLDDFFKGARNTNGDFTPTGVTRQINRLGGDDKLIAILTPEQFKAVKNIDTVAKSFGNLDKITQGSQTAFLTRIAGEAALLGANPIAGLKVIIGDAAASKFIASPTGQAMLGEGITLTGKTGKRIIRSSKPIGEASNILRVEGMRQKEER